MTKFNSLFSPEILKEIFNPENSKKKKQDKEYSSLNTETYCRYSGVLIQVDNIFQGNQNIRFSKHWIFSQTNETILSYLIKSKTAQQKHLSQLAALNAMDLVIFNSPMNTTNSAIHNSHAAIIDLFIIYVRANEKTKTTLLSAQPKLRVEGNFQNNTPNYSRYIKNLYENTIRLFDIDLDLLIEQLSTATLGTNSSLNKELANYSKKTKATKYSKAIGKEVLEVLATQPANKELIEHLEKCKTYLLNDGYSRPHHLARVFKIINESVSPIEDSFIEKKQALTLTYLADKIEKTLEDEKPFYGKRLFSFSTGKISSVESIFSKKSSNEKDSYKLDLDLSMNTKSKIKSAKDLKLKISIKSKLQIKK